MQGACKRLAFCLILARLILRAPLMPLLKASVWGFIADRSVYSSHESTHTSTGDTSSCTCCDAVLGSPRSPGRSMASAGWSPAAEGSSALRQILHWNPKLLTFMWSMLCYTRCCLQCREKGMNHMKPQGGFHGSISCCKYSEMKPWGTFSQEHLWFISQFLMMLWSFYSIGISIQKHHDTPLLPTF